MNVDVHRALRFGSLGGLLALLACEGPGGEDGADGRDGQDGAGGATGADGAAGGPGATGAPGTIGPPGADGHDGRDGHVGDPPWGLNLTLVSVGGASGGGGEFQVGDIPSITFSVLDDDGHEYDMPELSGLSVQLSGPTSHYQNVLSYDELASVKDTAVYNFDGTWTWTSDLPIPSVYDTPLNDTLDLGIDQGDLGGQALVDGTYTVASWASVRVTEADGTSYTVGSNATFDVLFGAATDIEPRSVVLADNCAQCHGPEFVAHGGSRRDLGVCLTCHIDGAEDRYSATDPTVTPGQTIAFGPMVHGIHSGETRLEGLVVAGYPADPNGVGAPNYNLADFGDVIFPSWPMGSADCDSCHGGAEDGDVEDRPTRQACGSCHDAIDFTEVDSLADDYHPGGPQSDDSNCTVCHSFLVSGYHVDPRESGDLWPGAGHAAGKVGLNVELLDAVDQDGSSTFDVGDTVTIRFTVKYDDGTDIPQSFFAYSALSSTCPTVAGGATLKLAGPSEHMQTVLSSASPSVDTVVGSIYGSSTVNADGEWTYRLQDTLGVPLTVPAVYPFQTNDDLLVGVDFGDQVGLPLTDGTYRLALDMYTGMWDDPSCGEGAERWRETELAFVDVLVGAATVVEPHAVVSDADCAACHTNLEFHGDTRVGVDYCVTCHTPGAMDSAEAPLVTIDFPVMIHKIHASDSLENGYAVDGDEPFDVTFPRQDGGVQACTACHGTNEAYLVPSTRACVTCHDSDATMAHAAINTDPTWGESCDVCHGDGSQLSVEIVHAWAQ